MTNAKPASIKAEVVDDLVIARGKFLVGPEITGQLLNLSNFQLRYDGLIIIDANTITKWLIDDKGRKRLPEMHKDKDWQALDCPFDAELIHEPDGWRVKTDADQQKEAVEKAQAEFVANLRSQITENVADTESLLGTVSDATGLLIAIALTDIVALSTSTDFTKYKKAKLDTLNALAGDADLAALAGGALAQIQSGDAVLTASLKGVENVINESLARSTGVVHVLTSLGQSIEEDG